MIIRSRVVICLAVSLIGLCAFPFVAAVGSAPVRIWGIAFFPDGKRLATASSDGSLQIWSADGQSLLATPQLGDRSLHAIAISPDGKRLATAGVQKHIHILNTDTWTAMGRLIGHEGPVISLAYSPDGKRLASTSMDKTVRLWDTGSGAEVAVLRGHTARVTTAAFSPDGALLASVADDATPRVWDVATGQAVAAFDLPDTKEITRAAVFTRDSCCLVVSDRSNIYAWDMRQKTLKYTARGGLNVGLAALPDGRRIVSADRNMVFLYDAATGKLKSSYSPHGIQGPDGRYPHEFGDILAFALSRDGQSFALTSSWGGIHVASIASIDAQQARADAEDDEPRNPLCMGSACADVKLEFKNGCVALTNSTARIMSANTALLGGGAHKFTIQPRETRHIEQLMGDCVKSINALKSIDLTYINESELPKPLTRREDQATPPTSSPKPSAQTNPDVERKPEQVVADETSVDEWKVCGSSSYADSMKAIEACTRLIAQPGTVAASRRAEAFLKRGQLRDGLLSLSSPDKTEQAKILNDYTESIRLDSTKPLAYLARARLAGGMGDKKRALADYTEVIRLDPGNAAGYRGRGGIYTSQDDPDRALADLTKGIELEPDSVAYELRAKNYEKKGELRAAFADFDAAAGRSPKNSFQADILERERDRVGRPLAKNLTERGQSAAQKGDTDRAFADFSEALRFDYKNWRANFERGMIYLRRGDLNKAERDIRTAINQFAFAKPGDWPPEIAKAHVSLGEMYEKQHQLSAALLSYNEALRAPLTPEDADSVRRRADRVRSQVK